MKKWFLIGMAVILALSLLLINPSQAEAEQWDGSVATGFDSGSGTQSDPYIIRTPAQLAYLSESVSAGNTYSGKYIRLEADLQMNDESFAFLPDSGLVEVTDGTNIAYLGTGHLGDESGSNTVFDATPSEPGKWYASLSGDAGSYGGHIFTWTPIGLSSPSFFGYFDGGNHLITGLFNAFGNDYTGLFGRVVSAAIMDTKISNSYFCGQSYTGGIVGYASEALISNCHSNGIVCGYDYVGGIAGQLSFSVAEICSNNNAVHGNSYVGGIAGSSFDEISNSYNKGRVSGNSYVGGIAGSNSQSIYSCYNVGMVYGTYGVGNIVGKYSTRGILLDCYYMTGCAVDASGVMQNGTGAETAGATTIDQTDCCTGLSYAQMQSANALPGLDFSHIWTFDVRTGSRYPVQMLQLNPLWGENSALWDGSVAAGFASGNGTYGDPYVISTPAQLAYFSKAVTEGNSFSGQYIVLSNDIALNDTSARHWVLNAQPWQPVGNASSLSTGAFSGVFNGMGHTISGLYIRSFKDNFQGLFSNIDANGVVQNLSIRDSYIHARGANYTGAIAAHSKGNIINCHNDALVFGDSCTGGIVGYSFGNVQFSSNTGNISGTGLVGGISGSHGYYVISNCYNTGTILGHEGYVGGIVGSSTGNSATVNGSTVAGSNVVMHCYNIGKVRGHTYTGAIMGKASYTRATQSYYLAGCAVNLYGEEQFGIGSASSMGSTPDVNGQINARTGPQLQQAKNLKGFDFDTFWKIDSSTGYLYPQLAVQIDGLPKPAGLWNGTVAEGFASGTGTKNDPYVIETPEQLAYLAQTVNGGTSYSGRYFVLANNIYLNDTSDPLWFLNAAEWLSIGNSNRSFNGKLNGNGHYISGVYLVNHQRTGLFSNLNAATIENLGVVDSLYYNYYASSMGGIAGSSTSSTIKGCYSEADIYGAHSIGGIVGYSRFDTITDCYNTGDLTSIRVNNYAYAGGIVGYGNNGKISTSYNVGTVLGMGTRIGGILGGSSSSRSCTLTSCYYLSNCATDFSGDVYCGDGNLTSNIPTATKSLSAGFMKQQSHYAGFDFDNQWVIYSEINDGHPIHAARLLAAVQLVPPTKTEYIAGELFDQSGLALKAILDDGSQLTLSGFTCSLANGTQLSAGEYTVTVTWGNFSETFTVTAQLRDMDSVTVNDLKTPARGETPDTTATVTEPLYANIDSIRWSTDGVFEYGKSYTVTMVLSPTEYALFNEHTAVSICGVAAHAEYDSTSGTITATCTFRSIIRYSIHVVDEETGRPIPGATVTLGSTTVTTGSDGIAFFELSNDGSTYLKVSASGYPDHIVENYQIVNLPSDYVQLYASSSGIHSVTCNGQDIIHGNTVINRFAFARTAQFEVSARSSANILRYELVQNGVVIATSTTGSFRVPNRQFGGISIFSIRVYTDGLTHNVYERPVHIWVVGFTMDSILDLNDLIPGAGGASFSIPNDVDILGGLKLDFPINDKNSIAPKVELYNDKAVITIGWDRNLLKNPDSGSSFKDMYNEMMVELAQRKKDFSPHKSHSGTLAGVLVVEVNHFGEVSAVYGEIVYEVTYDCGTGKTVVLYGVPIRLDVEVGLGGQLRINNIGYDFENAKILIPELVLKLNGELTAYAGFGFSFLSAGVYGNTSASMDLSLLPFELQKLELNGELGVYAKIKLFFLKKTVKLSLISGTVSWPQQRRMLYSLNTYGLAMRTNLPLRTDWASPGSRYDIDAPDESILQESAYDRIEPTIVTCGDVRMMLFMDDDGSAGHNYQQLYFSLYDASTGTWGDPQLVSDDLAPDIEFDAVSDGSNIYITYTQSGLITDPDTEDLSPLVSTFEIWAASYDAKSGQFTGHTNLSQNTTYDYLPQIAVDHDGACVVWVSNHTGDFFAQNANNVLFLSRLGSNGWSEAAPLTGYGATVTDMDLGMLEGKLRIAAIRDMDSSLTTDDDLSVYLIDLDGTIRQLQTQTNENSGITFAKLDGEENLLWFNNANIYRIDCADGTPAYLFAEPIQGLTNYFKLVNMGSEDILLFAKGSTTYDSVGNALYGSDIYGIVCKNGVWGQPVCFKDTQNGRYVEYFDAMCCNDQLVIPYLSTAVSFGAEDFTTSSDLRCILVDLPQDLTLVQVDVDKQTLYNGSDIAITAVIANHSWCATESIRISLLTEDGTVVWQDNISYTIPSGKNGEITVEIPHAILDKAVNYFLQVQSNDYTEAKMADNMLPLTLWQADMEVVARYVRLGSGDILQYALSNLGGINGSGTLYVYKLVDGQKVTLYTKAVSALVPGQTISGTLNITDNFYTNDKTGSVYVEFVTDGVDASVADNSALVAISAIPYSGTTEMNGAVSVPAPTTEDGYLVYNRTAGGDLVIHITENGFTLRGVEGMASSAYTYQNGVLTIHGDYLQGFAGDHCYIDMVFTNGQYSTQVLSVIAMEGIVLQDTSLRVEPSQQIVYDGKPIEEDIDFQVFTLSTGSRSYAYSTDGAAWIEGLPTDAGSYTVRIAIAADTENGYLPLETTFTVVINKATRAISIPAFIGSDGLCVIFGNASPTLGVADGQILYGSSTVNDPLTVTNWSAEGRLDAAEKPGTVYLFAMIGHGANHEAAYSLGTAVDAHIHSYSQTVTPPTCEDGGYTLTACRCGDSFTSDLTDALGHNEQHHNAKSPTCTEIGWNAYVTCSRCDYTTYQELIKLPHNSSLHYDDLQHWLECDDCHLKQEITAHSYGEGIICSVCSHESALVAIHITALPDKLIYLTDEDLDLSGMEVYAEYANGNFLAVQEFTVSGYDSTYVGTQTVTVAFHGASATFEVEVRSRIPDKITSSVYRVENHIIRQVAYGNTIGTFLNGINERNYVTVTMDGLPISYNLLAGTGLMLKIMDGDTVKDYATLVVTGDVNGDGKITVTDYIQMKSHLLGKATIEPN